MKTVLRTGLTGDVMVGGGGNFVGYAFDAADPPSHPAQGDSIFKNFL